MSGDINTVSIWDRHGVSIVVPPIQYVPGNSDGLKVSRSTGCDISCEAVQGGKEDVLDINNHCKGNTVQIGKAYPNGKYVCTIKGGSERNHVLIAKLIGRGSEVDIDFGNRSDQSDNPTIECTVHIEAVDDPRVPVRWRSINARRCKVTGGPAVRIHRAFWLPGWLGEIVNKVWNWFV